MNENFKSKLNKALTVELNVQKYKDILFENIATMLAAGIDIQTILNSQKQEIKSQNVEKVIKRLEQRVQNGEPLWRIFEEEKFVGSHLTALVRIGEQTGSLPKNLDLVVNYKRRENEFAGKIRSASLYPGFVLSLLFLVAIVMLGFVLPRLTSIYESFDVELPPITQVMINIGNFFRDYGIIAIPVSILLIVTIIYIFFFRKKTKYLGQKIMFSIPIIKKLLVETETSRFGYLLNNLLECGLSPSESLNLLSKATEFKNYRELYSNMADLVEKGFSLSEIIYSSPKAKTLLPSYARELVSIGEKTGRLPENLFNIGQTFEKRNEVSLKDASVIFEPALLIMVWGGIAFVAVAVILPLYSIIGNISSLTTGVTQDATVEQVQVPNVINDPLLLDASPAPTVEDNNFE